MAWTDPISWALDGRETRLRVFVRDDDAGWNDERLFLLLDMFAREEFPIDLAVIPTVIGPRLVSELTKRSAGAALRVHQHGFAHTNHQPGGRKCEFGDARSTTAMRADIATGRRLLLDRFGPLADPIFTPPWNRCTRDRKSVV